MPKVISFILVFWILFATTTAIAIAAEPLPEVSPADKQVLTLADTKFRLGQALMSEAQLTAQLLEARNEISALKVKCGEPCKKSRTVAPSPGPSSVPEE